MAKVIGIIILILIAIRGMLKSTARHKIGYVLIAAWSLPLFFDSLGQKLSAYFENHELAAEIYHGPLIPFLLVYGAVGILEGLIRRRDGEFTFLRLLIGRKRRTDITEEEYNSAEKMSLKPEEPKGSREELSPAKVIYPDKNVSMLKSPGKSDPQTITTADARAAAEMEFGTAETETKSLHLPDYCRMFALRQSYWDHGIEWEVYSALRLFISDDYIVIPHEAFSNLFYWKWEDDWKLTDRVTKAHFDFAIYNNYFMPIMLIEVNGSTHKCSPNRMEMDEFKRKLAAEKGVRLISIDATKTIGNIQQEVEERIRHEFPDRDSCPTYCPVCHSRIRMILQRNKSTNEYFYRCVNKECGTTHSLGRSGEYRKIAPLYRNMPDKLF